MKEFKYSMDQVLNMGFFEAHRMWLISDEMRSRDLQNLSLVMDFAHGDEDTRRSFLEWIESRQPRRYSSKVIPKEVMDKFAEAFENGRRQ